MSACVRLDGRRQHVQRRHVAMITVGVELHDLHRLELFEPCFLRYLVFSFIGIVLKVSDIRDITDVAYLVAEVLQVAIEDIECDSRTGMSQMGISIHGRAADIHAYVPFV